jgi:hypothetical protein
MSTLRVPARSDRSIGSWQRVGCHGTPLRWRVEKLVENPFDTWPSETSRGIASADPQPTGDDDTFDAALLDPESSVVMIGEPVGVFDDLWVRQRAAFSFRAQAAITSLSVELWTPPKADPFSLAVRLAGEPELMTTAPGGHVAVLQYPLYAAPFSEFTIELIAGCERQLDPPDQRHAAYKIRRIGLY